MRQHKRQSRADADPELPGRERPLPARLSLSLHGHQLGERGWNNPSLEGLWCFHQQNFKKINPLKKKSLKKTPAPAAKPPSISCPKLLPASPNPLEQREEEQEFCSPPQPSPLAPETPTWNRAVTERPQTHPYIPLAAAGFRGSWAPPESPRGLWVSPVSPRAPWGHRRPRSLTEPPSLCSASK